MVWQKEKKQKDFVQGMDFGRAESASGGNQGQAG